MENLEHKIPTVLIVDDMTTNIVILSDLLKEEYRVRIAKNGEKALEIARSSDSPDIILLDVVMPTIDGYEVCRKLKNEDATKNIPIIFVTAKSDEKDEEMGLSLGAVDYITKPFNPTIVKMRVRNHVALKLKSDMLEQLSMYDGLTHIPNRRYFDEHFQKEYKAAQREQLSLAVLMLDVDFFKPYNDNYGHGKGDETLIKIAQTLNKMLKRPNDMVARYGGEEFVVVLKGIDIQGVKTVCTTLLNAIEELQILHEYSSVSSYVTISIGVKLKESLDSISQEELLKSADDALYQAKQNGRNQFFMS